ncbi:phosphomevalonate kinase [Nonomuraea solani]|uniref:phosphomevalonate kinase n=1 Tax=Nonomuraea solani TaxID=1144553 RepID=A0A1H6EQR3_9ACTN|nr:phosphomevalonate kinase [Nonomuraea solani]SEG99753.1 phosphomevalonate kinase [Nonomuraea solani]
MTTFRAPGKLFIAGEYAVVEPCQPAVLVAVNRYATVTVTGTGGATTLTSDLAGGLTAEYEPGRTARGPFAFVAAAVHVMERLAAEHRMPIRPFRLLVTTDLTGTGGRKLGLGSSAAVTVATCGALARFYGLRLTRMDLYRTAMLATHAVAPASSGGDVAASTFGGWLLYHSPGHRPCDATVTAALGAEWPGLMVRPLAAPPGAHLEVGWTGETASTPELVGRLGEDHHRSFLAGSADCVSSLVTGLEHGDITRMQHQVNRARGLLTELDTRTGLGWMTPRLHALCRAADAIGVAAKPSGAGGGDCGIALLRPDQEHRVPALREQWTRDGIQPLHLRLHPTEQDRT